jgi:hypothetical protein
LFSSRKVFFSEEKKQNTFSSLSRFYPAADNRPARQERLFLKENRLSPLRLQWVPITEGWHRRLFVHGAKSFASRRVAAAIGSA